MQWVLVAQAEVTAHHVPDDGLDERQGTIELLATSPITDLQIVLEDVRHKPIADRVQRETQGNDELETFQSELTAIVRIDNLGSSGLDGVRIPVVLTGPVQTLVRDKAVRDTGTFQTEIVAMSLTGNVGGIPIQISESPNQQ